MKPAIAACAAPLFAAALLLCGACSADRGEAAARSNGTLAPAAQAKTDIRGRITNMSFRPDDSGVTLRIEGEKEADTSVDKASVSTKENLTKLFRRKPDGSREPITMMAFRNGQTVEATFTGPVAESYPVQATAAEIVIVGEK